MLLSGITFFLEGLFIVSIIIAIWHMLSIRGIGAQNQEQADYLSLTERLLIVFSMLFGGIIIPGSIYYYGWKGRFPQKAKSVLRTERILLVLLMLFIFGGGLLYRQYVLIPNAQTQAEAILNQIEQQQKLQQQNTSLVSNSAPSQETLQNTSAPAAAVSKSIQIPHTSTSAANVAKPIQANPQACSGSQPIPSQAAQLTLTTPSNNASYIIGNSIPVSYAYTNAPPCTHVVITVTLVQASARSGNISGGEWESTEVSGSGDGVYTALTGNGSTDIPGTYRITALLKTCDPAGCQYYYPQDANLPTYASSVPVEFNLNSAQ